MKASRRPDAIFRQTLAAAGVMTGAMLLLWSINARPLSASAAEDDSIRFSHPNHVAERGIACADCHTNAPGSTLAADKLIPGHESCQGCHEEPVKNDCAYCHTDPDDIRPTVMPARDLVFPHATHAGGQNISCETCHGGAEAGAAAAEPHIPAMAMCVDCHAAGKASNECETCHTDFARLFPATHLASGFAKEHSRPVRAGAMEIDCAVCHRESFCQECHAGDELRRLPKDGGLMTAPGARTPLRDSPDALRLQAAHDLNYKFTHAVDARSRSFECSSCHENRTFCAECHRAGGIGTDGTVKPASHSEAGWVTVPGSGGGRHAELGRRDIESCVSCHDTEGKEPSCALCHSGR